MYDINSIGYYHANGVRDGLSNLCGGDGRNKCATIFDFQDAVEDSKDALSLAINISALCLNTNHSINLDRDTATYTRLRLQDACGNVKFIIIHKLS